MDIDGIGDWFHDLGLRVFGRRRGMPALPRDAAPPVPVAGQHDGSERDEADVLDDRPQQEDAMSDGYPKALRLSSADWPDGCPAARPGDLTVFVPQGFVIGGPMIVTPYGEGSGGGYYGADAPHAHPFLNAPTTDCNGGTLYFGEPLSDGVVQAGLHLVGLRDNRDYVAFASASAEPLSERYLDQVRFVSAGALKGLFGARDVTVMAQSLTISEAVVGFMAAQNAKWCGGYGALQGLAGGDGDWAKEQLSFGFHVENTYWGVYRLWSRAWLVTK